MNIQEPEPEIHYHFVSPADTCQFLVADPVTKHAVIIDPVLDHKHDPSQGPISTRAADALLELIHRNRYHIDRVLETHALPASLSSAWYLRTQIRERFGYTPRVYIGKSIDFVSRFFARNGVHDSGWAEGFDNVFSDGESLTMGDIAIHVLALPGLSLDHIGYRVGKNVFIGEYIFHPKTDVTLAKDHTEPVWASYQKLLRLPPEYRVYIGRKVPEPVRPEVPEHELTPPFATIQQHRQLFYHQEDALGMDGSYPTSSHKQDYAFGQH